MRVILDTNVLISGFVSFKNPKRAPAQILQSWQAGLFELCISEHILAEVEKTLNDQYFLKRFNEEDRKEIIILLQEESILISKIVLINGVATHPEDDLVIAAAVSGKVDYLVTGDGPLFRKVGNYKGVRLISPNDFLEVLKKQI